MRTRSASIASALLVLCFTQATLSAVVQLDDECRNNINLKLEGRSDEVLNGCLRDQSSAGILLYMSEQFVSWVGVEELLLYTTLTLAFIPMISWWSNPDPEIAARVDRIRFHFVALIFRLAFAQSVTVWFNAVFRSDRPCECRIIDGSEFVYVGELEDYGPWGMPNLECVAGTMFSLFLFENFLPIPALILMGMFPMTQMSIGYASLVQGLVGIAFGVVLHFYIMRTAIFMRLIDFVFNIIIGFVVLSEIKKDRPETSFSWANSFVFSIIWQAYAISLMWIYFDRPFLKAIAHKSITGVHQVDFVNHIHGDKMPLSPGVPQPHEQNMASVSLTGLLFLLILFRILTNDFDDWLD